MVLILPSCFLLLHSFFVLIKAIHFFTCKIRFNFLAELDNRSLHFIVVMIVVVVVVVVAVIFILILVLSKNLY